MKSTPVFIGFGEAGMAFSIEGARAYDIKTDDPGSRDAKLADYRSSGLEACFSLGEALGGADVILCLVTADQAAAAAARAAGLLAPGALWLDMNSVAPQTKRAVADRVTAAGGRYVDVAIMAPVQPKRRDTPLLLSGADAEDAARRLRACGFGNVRVVGEEIGRASTIKMVRSVMVKGIEALTAECFLAAEAAGVTGEVIASLDASASERGWAARADYNLDRMMVHGLRRAAEMEEVARTLDGLGVDGPLTRASLHWQRAIGSMDLAEPPQGLAAKLGLLGGRAGGRSP